MKMKFNTLIVLLAAFSFTAASGQTSQVLYYMNLPQNHSMNPALRPTNSVYVGLPVVSGFNLTVNNNFLNFSDLIIKGQSSDSLITFLHPDYNVDQFISKLNKKNSVSPEISVQLFGLGFAAGNNYFFLDINDRVESNVVIPKDLITLMLKGNEGFAGSTIDLNALRLDARWYREIGVGMSRSFNKLRLGIKGKLLFGIANMSVSNKDLGIHVNDDYSHTLNADMTVNFSAPVNVYTSNNNKIDSIAFDDSRFNTGSGIRSLLMQTGNPGFALDMGATYELNDKIELSAALLDLGFISWQKDVTKLVAKSHFDFSGLSMVDVLKGDKTFKEVGDEMTDSLKNAFSVSSTNSGFSTWLPASLTLGGSYKLTKDITMGVVSYSRFIGRQVREAVTVSANANFGSLFSATLGYTMSNHRADNIGAGIAFRGGITQFYIMTDRIPVSWTKLKGDSSAIFPSNWNTLNLRVGMNLCFGNRIRKKEDVPMI